MILRDVDLSTAWNAQADALDTRHYYCQNWRADVSVIIDDSAELVERVMYSPYGVPFGIPVGDLVDGGGNEPANGSVGNRDSTELTNTYWGSSYNIADLDNDGDVDSADSTILTNNNGATLGWGALSQNNNRLGYAGYVHDETLADTKWHVRHRVLESVWGRWITRDPLEYVDGMALAAYTTSNPIVGRDSSGQFQRRATLGQQEFDDSPWFTPFPIECDCQGAPCYSHHIICSGEVTFFQIKKGDCNPEKYKRMAEERAVAAACKGGELSAWRGILEGQGLGPCSDPWTANRLHSIWCDTCGSTCDCYGITEVYTKYAPAVYTMYMGFPPNCVALVIVEVVVEVYAEIGFCEVFP